MLEESITRNHYIVVVFLGKEGSHMDMDETVKNRNGQCSVPLHEATAVKEQKNWMPIFDGTWLRWSVDIEFSSCVGVSCER